MPHNVPGFAGGGRQRSHCRWHRLSAATDTSVMQPFAANGAHATRVPMEADQQGKKSRQPVIDPLLNQGGVWVVRGDSLRDEHSVDSMLTCSGIR